MTESSFVPACLCSSTPRVEVRDRRQPLTPTLAGFALRPGKRYAIRVTVPGRASSEWKLRREDQPAILSQFEPGDSDESTHELCFQVPWWPENFWKGLAAGHADLKLTVAWQDADSPPQQISVPMHLRPSPLSLLLVLIPVLLHLLGKTDLLSQKIVESARSAWGVNWDQMWVTGIVCVAAGLFCMTTYLWYKKRFQPARRVRRLRGEMLARLAPES